ncbi:ABC transporter [Mesorhizobium sp. ANAO-SY3R2]
MSRFLAAAIAIIAVAGLSGCAYVGKGKAPPPAPVVEPAPVYK